MITFLYSVVLLPVSILAHVLMNKPIPYNFHSGASGLIQVDPLGPTLPFPCQGRVDTGADHPTVITAGGTQLVNFTGGAQHAGGSCQFSINYHSPSDPDARNWKAFYTLIGGCPLQRGPNSNGNVDNAASDSDQRRDGVHCGNDSGLDCLRQFDVPFPKELKNGNATFAWTWFNYLGKREMYMNCAPVTIAGGSDSSEFVDGLPQIYVANIPDQTVRGALGTDDAGMCMMKEQNIVNIPNPGRYGRILETPTATPAVNGNCTLPTVLPTFTNKPSSVGLTVIPFFTNATALSATCTGCQMSAASVTSHISPAYFSVTDVASRSHPVKSSITDLMSPASGSQVINLSSNTLMPNAIPMPSPSYSLSSSSISSSLITSVVWANSSSIVPTNIDGPTSPSSCAQGKPCSKDGFVCFDSGHFGLCQYGCAIPQPVAAGTACKDGQIVPAR